MKNILIKTFFFLFICTSFWSCDEFLNLEPETSLSSALVFDNLEGIEAGINGIYSVVQADWVERQYIFAECLASSVKEINTLNNANYQVALRHQNWTDLFNSANYLWQLSYRAIDVSNQILVALPEIEAGTSNQTEADKKRLEGEALFLRASMYFVLNRFFAQPQNGLSVPLLTAPFQPEDQPARATIESIKAHVIEDLLAAEILMTDVKSNNNRATIWAVKGMLARVNFEYKNYEEARIYANDVIENGPFELIDGNVKAAFSTMITSENIFTFVASSIDRAANNLFTRYSLNSNNIQLSLSDNFWNTIKLESEDLRLTSLHEETAEGVASRKYDDRNMHIAYIRLPEMFLIRAESAVLLDDLENGGNDLNRLRQRAALPPVAISDKNLLLQKVFIDRSLELAMEGDYFHNLKRLERPIGGYTWEEAKYKLVFFIPEKEIQLNSNLVQNDIW